MLLLIVYIINGIIFGAITKYVSESKGYEGGFAWGFWLGIIGLLVVGFRPDVRQTETNSTPQTLGYSYGHSDEVLNEYNSWLCRCGKRNPNRIEYCLSCKRSKDEANIKKYCPHCGAANNEENKYCFACHKPMDGSVETPQPQTKKENKSDFETVLEQLANLHEKGILTDEEFNRKKAEILDDLSDAVATRRRRRNMSNAQLALPQSDES